MEQVCKSYASALYSLLEEDERDAYKDALLGIADDFKENPSFFRALCSYRVKASEKDALLSGAYGKLKLKHLLPFLSLLCKKHRISSYPDIKAEFVSLVEEGENVKTGIVYSAEKLSDEQLSSIEASLKAKTSSEVRLSNVVDASLLGGVKVALDGKVYDGSLRGKLLSLAKQLQGGNQ